MELINIFDDLKNDMSIENIIKKYKIGLSRLIKIVKFHNNTGIDFEEKISKEIYDLKKCGNTYEEIAEISYTGVTYIRNYIKKYCTENNLEVPKLEFKRNKIDLPLKEIYDMKKSGVSVDKISDKYNVSYGTIYNRLKEINIEILLYLFQSIIDKENDKSINHFIEKEIGYAKQMKDH